MSGDVEVVLVRGRGAPRPRRRVVTFKVDAEVVELLDAIARRMGKSRGEVIREAIEQYLAGCISLHARPGRSLPEGLLGVA